jgi:PAS domain S-box-containing protein
VEFVSNVYLVNGRKVIQCNIRDISAKKRAEEALWDSGEQFRAMFEVASIGMAQADVQTGQWLRVNHKMCAITGYSADEMLKMRILDITHPDDRKKDWEEFQRVVKGEAPDYRLEKRYIRKDGSVIWVNANVTIIRDVAGQPVRTIAAIEDITERKASEQQIRQLSQAVEQTPISIILTDTKGYIHYVNPKFTEVTGYSLDEVLGRTPRLLKSGHQSPGLYKKVALHLYRIAQEAISNAVRHGGAQDVVILLRRHEGRVSMLIRDDGSGISQPLPLTSGMGLRSMRYRAESIGATLEIRPGASGGTEILCTLPEKP